MLLFSHRFLQSTTNWLRVAYYILHNSCLLPHSIDLKPIVIFLTKSYFPTLMSGGLLTGSWSFFLSSRYLTLIIIIIIIDRRSCLLYIVKNIWANIYRLLIKEYILFQSYFRTSFGQNHLTNN